MREADVLQEEQQTLQRVILLRITSLSGSERVGKATSTSEHARDHV